MKLKQIFKNIQCSESAPTPYVLSNEKNVFVSFYLEAQSLVNPIDASIHNMSTDEITTLRFESFVKYKFGKPDENSIETHPLFHHGLQACTFYKVKKSRWLKKLKKQHPDLHINKKTYTHYLLFFHQTCFEIVAKSCTALDQVASNMQEELSRISEKL
jgi:hypothetical protein